MESHLEYNISQLPVICQVLRSGSNKSIIRLQKRKFEKVTRRSIVFINGSLKVIQKIVQLYVGPNCGAIDLIFQTKH